MSISLKNLSIVIILFLIWGWTFLQFINDLIADIPLIIATIASLLGISSIIYGYIKKVEINLSTINTYLYKGKEESYSDFLERGKDPYYYDFKKGYLTERKEVREIINKLKKNKKNKKHLIMGHPASGKSVVGLNIGYKLSRKITRYDVFVIKIRKEFLTTDIDEIFKIKNKKTLLIIDDIQLDIDGCNTLLEKVWDKKFKILLCGRSDVIKRKTVPRSGSRLDNLMQNDMTHTIINANSSFPDILRNFEDKKKEKVKEGDKRILREQFSHDLWLLTLVLNIYNSIDGMPSKEKIYDKIKDDIMKDIYREIHADDILLPISFFYSYEKQISMNLLTEVFGLNYDNIMKLVNYGEIIETDKQLSMHHSSRARIFFEVFKENEKMGENVKAIMQKKFGEWNIGLYHQFFQSKPESCVKILSSFSKKYKQDLISKLMTNEKTKKDIFENILDSIQGNNCETIRRLIQSVSDKIFSKNLFFYLWANGLLIEFLNNSKLNQIGNLFEHTYSHNSSIFQKAYRRFDKDYLFQKISDANLGEIGRLIHGIKKREDFKGKFIGMELALEIIQKLKKLNDLSKKLEDVPLSIIAPLLKNVDDVSGETNFLTDCLISLPDFDKKIEESTIDYIGTVVKYLRKNNAEYFGAEFDLSDKIKNSSLNKLGFFINNISDEEPLYQEHKKIIEKIDLTQKIEDSSLDGIRRFLWHYYEADPDIPKIFTDKKLRTIIRNRLNKQFQFSMELHYFLFNLAKRFEKKMNKGIIPILLRKQFESQEIMLSQNIIIKKSSKKDNEWEIIDQNNVSNYLVVMNNEKLDIFRIENNIGEQLCINGIFIWAGCSILDKNDNYIAKFKLPNPKLSKWVNHYISLGPSNPFKIALALKGFRDFDEEKAISFLTSNSSLKMIINCLKTAIVKNDKSKQLIEGMLSWLKKINTQGL